MRLMNSLTRLLLAGGLCAVLAPSLAAQTVIDACYVDKTGILYLIDPTGTAAGDLPTTCTKPDKHVRFSWVDAVGADHGAFTGLDDDDHPQYLLISGVRAMEGDLDANGNRVTGLAAASAAGDAVRLDEAVIDGDAAGGDLGGTYPDPTVIAIQGNAVDAVTPEDGQLLGWDESSASWKPMTAEMVISDHGNLQGLTDDDHPQYLLVNGVRNGTTSGNGFGNSMALGHLTVSTGFASFASGNESRATRASSTAMGYKTQATGSISTAMGTQTVASGEFAMAMGALTTASGARSTTMGSNASTNFKTGAFVYGDFSTSSPFEATGNNQFLVRAVGGVGLNVNDPLPGGLSVAGTIESRSGGVRFPDGTTQTTAAGGGFDPNASQMALGCNAQANHSATFVWSHCGLGTFSSTATNQFSVLAAGGTRFASSALIVGGTASLFQGVQLVPGAGAWSTLSARESKHDFRDEDGEAVLSKIAGLDIQSWSYKAQDSWIRHLGPVAEDFYAAFGLGEDEHRITTTDIDGVNLLAVQALEGRTTTLRQEIDALRTENDELRDRLVRLEAALATLQGERR